MFYEDLLVHITSVRILFGETVHLEPYEHLNTIFLLQIHIYTTHWNPNVSVGTPERGKIRRFSMPLL
jgi:hypothetical protein